MNYNKETQGKKFVIGVAIKTSNQNGQFQKDVPPFWEKFYREKTVEKIPRRKNKNLLAVYTDYEGDHTNPITYIIGCEVADLSAVPEGMVGIEVAPATYAIFTTKGAFPECMGQAWHTIWHSHIERSYITDFEIYGPDFNPQTKPEVKIEISLKGE